MTVEEVRSKLAPIIKVDEGLNEEVIVLDEKSVVTINDFVSLHSSIELTYEDLSVATTGYADYAKLWKAKGYIS